MTQEAHMWSYWRDKKGFEEALEDYFPELLASNPTLQHAYHQIKAMKLTINAEFEKLVDAENEEYE